MKKRLVNPATLPSGMGVPATIAALLAAADAGYVPKASPAAEHRQAAYKFKELQIERLRTVRRVVPTPFAKAKSCKARYPTSQIRELRGGMVEIYEPATGFVYGRGKGTRAAVRDAMRRRA